MEDKPLVEVVFGQITNGQTDDPAKTAHFLGFKQMVKTELEAPKNRSGCQPHEGVEQQSLAAMHGIADAKAKNVTLIKYI